MARWVTRVFVQDTRPAKERTKSGRVKAKGELVTQGDVSGALKAAAAASDKMVKAKRDAVLRIVIEQEDEQSKSGNPFGTE